jgi:hypothetical protein
VLALYVRKSFLGQEQMYKDKERFFFCKVKRIFFFHFIPDLEQFLVEVEVAKGKFPPHWKIPSIPKKVKDSLNTITE